MTDHDRMVLKAAAPQIKDESNWFYDEVKKLKGKISNKQIKDVEKKAEERGGILYLSDICNLAKFKKGTHKEKRNRLQSLSNLIGITKGDNGAYYVFQILKRGLAERVKDATDFFLSKKEGKAVKRQRKIEARTGEVRKEIKVSMSSDEKKVARKERIKIRKAAAKLGISTEEYKTKMAAGEIKLKTKKNRKSSKKKAAA